MNSEIFTIIKEIAVTMGIIAPSFTLLWKSFSEKKKVDPQLKLIRNKAKQEIVKVQSKAEITRIEVQRDAKLTKLKIEEEAIKEEVKHLARIKGLEMGVAELEKKESSTDFLSSLTQQGTSFLKNKVGDLGSKLKVDKVGDLLNKKEKQ